MNVLGKEKQIAVISALAEGNSIRVLKIPPVDSPQTAVKLAIAAKARG